jgi:type IV fimbrial biogenesis protein FimT
MLAWRKKSQHGFTLIELMIAIALLGIVAALGLPSYNVWIQNTMIRNAAESIQNGLQKARMEAVKRNTSIYFELGANSAWKVGCVTPTADCPDPIEKRAAKEGSSTNISVPAVPAGATTVVFNSLGLVLTIPFAATAPFNQLDITNLTLSAADRRNLRILVGPNGNVRMCDPSPSLPASDPRKCK